MKYLGNTNETASQAERVLMPDRYQQPFIDAFQTLTGCEVPEMSGRKRTIITAGRTFVWCRGRNIPGILQVLNTAEPNAKTIGLTGTEWCLEYENTPNTPTVAWQSLGKKKLGTVALIAPAQGDIQKLTQRVECDLAAVGVVTAYPNLVRSMNEIAVCNIFPAVTVDGGAEGIADSLKMPAVDLVSSGETIRENGFVVVKDLIATYPALVVRASTIVSDQS